MDELRTIFIENNFDLLKKKNLILNKIFSLTRLKIRFQTKHLIIHC